MEFQVKLIEYGSGDESFSLELYCVVLMEVQIAVIDMQYVVQLLLHINLHDYMEVTEDTVQHAL